jgi:hypothetical protein
VTTPKSKTLYDEAIADVKKLKELAETQARDLVLQKVEPRIKQLVEQQLFQESDDDEDEVDEASVTANVAGYMAPLGADPKKDRKLDEDDAAVDEQYEVAEGTESTLAHLADFARPITDDRFVAEVYRLQDDVNSFVTADKPKKLSDGFVSQLDSTISKLEDMYAYLKESYAGKDVTALEGKLEKSYGLANAVKESTMKMRDLLNEETLTMKVNGLPDDVDLDGVTVDIVADEGDEAGSEMGAPEMGGIEASAAPPGPPQMEGDDADEDDDEMLEISDHELKTELARLGSLREGDATPPPTKGRGTGSLSDFGDADEEGHLGPKGVRPEGIPEDAMNEADDEDEDEDDLDETQNLRTHDDTDGKDAYGAKVNESDDDDDDDTKMESVRRRLTRAAKRLSEARGTDKEDFARAMYRSAIRAYRSARTSLTEGTVKTNTKNSAPAAKNTATSKETAEANGKVSKLTKQLVESNLLNAKLIHANKLLRVEGLSKAQQAMVIDRLDEAQNLREVRLISESLLKVLAGSKDSINESARRPSGSASRPSQSGAASATLNEGLETARWAQLAGIK